MAFGRRYRGEKGKKKFSESSVCAENKRRGYDVCLLEVLLASEEEKHPAICCDNPGDRINMRRYSDIFADESVELGFVVCMTWWRPACRLRMCFEMISYDHVRREVGAGAAGGC